MLDDPYKDRTTMPSLAGPAGLCLRRQRLDTRTAQASLLESEGLPHTCTTRRCQRIAGILDLFHRMPCPIHSTRCNAHRLQLLHVEEVQAAQPEQIVPVADSLDAVEEDTEKQVQGAEGRIFIRRQRSLILFAIRFAGPVGRSFGLRFKLWYFICSPNHHS